VKSTSSIYIGGLFTARGDPGKKIALVNFLISGFLIEAQLILYFSVFI